MADCRGVSELSLRGLCLWLWIRSHSRVRGISLRTWGSLSADGPGHLCRPVYFYADYILQLKEKSQAGCGHRRTVWSDSCGAGGQSDRRTDFVRRYGSAGGSRQLKWDSKGNGDSFGGAREERAHEGGSGNQCVPRYQDAAHFHYQLCGTFAAGRGSAAVCEGVYSDIGGEVGAAAQYRAGCIWGEQSHFGAASY